jgi:subtilisin family serine protease
MSIQKKTVLAFTCIALTAGTQALAQEKSVAEFAAGKFLKSSNAVRDQYIVVLKDADVGAASLPSVAQTLAQRHAAAITKTFSHALRGFVVQTSEAQARALAAEPDVDYVEEDGVAYALGAQVNATWGLDRIDQRDLPMNGIYSYDRTGAGVHAYIIDTGILTSHSDFGGRASADFTSIADGNGANDCNGHGTHVAGTVGGTTYGVAKNARLHAVRVLGCSGSGTTSGVIAGVDWVTANHIKPAVANMSLGGGASQALDDALRRSITAGVTYVVAAGNSSADACNFSPARTGEAITVGATDSTDARASFSNYGTCLDLFGPGVNITSAYHNGGTASLSGTSMASPHVAGAAAVYLETNPSASPATVATALLNNATSGKVVNPGSGSSNRLLYSSPAYPSCGALAPQQSLARGQTLWSCAGNVQLAHQGDGNVVIYDRFGPIWATNTNGASTSSFVMQADGNLVLYSTWGPAFWASGTHVNPGAYMVMQNDCNLVVYNAAGAPLWASNTFCR